MLFRSEAVEGRFLNAKMAPATMALLHGLKVVAAPLPVWMEMPWKGEEINQAFHTGPLGQLGNSAKSSFGVNSESLWEEASYSPESKIAAELWDRFMGRGGLAIEVSRHDFPLSVVANANLT